MRNPVVELACEARRASLINVLVDQGRTITLERLEALLQAPKYGRDLAEITVGELRQPVRAVLLQCTGRSTEDAILQIFRSQPDKWLASSFFVENLRLHRWTAQSLLAELGERGLLERRGKTSGTRYRLVRGSSGR